MANEYDNIFEEMDARCELLREGQSREECCKEKGITNCPPIVRTDQESVSVYPLVFLGISLLIVCALLYLAVRKKWPQRIWNRLGETAKAVVSGWVVWFIVVFSYVLIKYSEDYLNLVMWLTLPPLSALAIHQWVRRFVRSGR